MNKTHAYFHSIWKEDMHAVPRFLWNAKMRFGKTFATYQLAKKLGATKVLVVTFKPAVEDAWQQDLESHADFDGWQYLSKATGTDPTTADKKKPLVYFGSFQDLLGKDKSGNIKPKNTWLHETNWDLVVFDEYHFGAWRDSAKELFEGEDDSEAKKEAAAAYNPELDGFNEELDELGENETEFLPITTKAYLYLSGTPFKALATGEFIEEQIFNWTYTDEQRAKRQWPEKHPGKWNPYGALPEMRLLTYQMPDELLAIAKQGEFDEFDLNEFFAAKGTGASAEFTHKNDVQKWLNIIRGAYAATQVDNLKLGARKPPFPYSDVRLLPYLNHSFWFLPSVASCHAMANLLAEKQNVFFHDYKVLTVAGAGAGVGLAALPPVREAIGSGYDSKTITLSCGKLTTGVTVPQWSSILMLRNLNSPETYFQAAFRVQSPWSIKNPNGDNPNEEEILKPVCFVFDFAPTRALRQIAEYGAGLSPEALQPRGRGEGPRQLPSRARLRRLPHDSGGRRRHPRHRHGRHICHAARAQVGVGPAGQRGQRHPAQDPRQPEGPRSGDEHRGLPCAGQRHLRDRHQQERESQGDQEGRRARTSPPKEKKELSAEEKEYKSKRKQIQEKLIKFATRIPAFMYLTDFRENTLKDVITKLEPDLFKAVTGLTVDDFHLLVSLNVFNSTYMNQAVFAFRRYEDASLSYTGIESHEGLRHFGLYDTVVAREAISS